MTVSVRDPRTGEIERALAPPSVGELAALADRLRSGQDRWTDIGAEGRATALRRWADELAAADDLLAALIRDTGRDVESHMEQQQVVAMARRWADEAPPMLAEEAERGSALPWIGVRQAVRPYQLVGVISPWNFPLLLGLIDAIPALAAGCAVLVKPSEVTPRFIRPLMRTVRAVPELAHVLAVVEGAGDIGEALLGHVDAVCFTGSVPTGRLVGQAAARAFIPAFLELGGKDAAVVLADADIDRASSAILWGGTANAGQSCQSIERVYVDATVFDVFVERLVMQARRLRLAWPRPEDGQIGPLIDPEQARVIERHLGDAAAKGAVARCGGHLQRHGGGWWCPPTVLTGVDHSMAVMTEETFGPVLPVMPFTGLDEAVRLANDTDYGLSAAVFAGGVDDALAVARRLDAGAVSINDAALTAVIRDGEKHSFKASGLGGSRMGPASLRRFVRRQAFLVNHGAGANPWWYDEQADGE
jgi:succinate-semialdehyde dehydrogenase / glutarate-semialdehyde dehydrogenase